MIVLVTGSRTMRDPDFLNSILDFFNNTQGISLLIEGGASGADRFAGEWAESRGVTYAVFPALWKAQGLSAGPVRNGAMIKFIKPDKVLAFVADGSKGTKNMIKQALDKNLKVHIYTEDMWNYEHEDYGKEDD